MKHKLAMRQDLKQINKRKVEQKENSLKKTRVSPDKVKRHEVRRSDAKDLPVS